MTSISALTAELHSQGVVGFEPTTSGLAVHKSIAVSHP